MAGQGASCSYIASILFYIETFNRVRGKLACTDLKRCLDSINLQQRHTISEVQDIKLLLQCKLKQKLDEKVENLNENASVLVSENLKTSVVRKKEV